MAEDKVSLWDIEDNYRHTCWRVTNADAQSLDMKKIKQKKATICIKNT